MTRLHDADDVSDEVDDVRDDVDDGNEDIDDVTEDTLVAFFRSKWRLNFLRW